jgi:two-component system chemotaxis sensor kinase CheA
VAAELRSLLEAAGKTPEPDRGVETLSAERDDVGAGSQSTAAASGSPEKQAAPQSEPAEPAPAEGAATEAESSEGAAAGGSASVGAHRVSEQDMAELQGAAESGSTVYRLVVSFNRDNPMNTVGGIQVFAALKRIGQVLETNPDFEALYEDNFFPTVDYYVATKEPRERIEEVTDIPDVTTGVQIEEVTSEAAEGGDRGEQAVSTGAPAGTAGTAGAAETQESAAASQDARARSGAESGNGRSAAGAEAAPAAASASQGGTAEEAPAEEQAQAEGPKGDGDGQKPAGKQQQSVTGSILRVDSQRIDDLLNLVSETVINKAAFNQITQSFTDNMTQFETAEERYRERLRELFDAVPEYAEKLQNGGTPKSVKKELQERFGELFGMFEEVHRNLKSSVNTFRGTAQNLGRITSELQEGVMRIRMVPISQIFSRFPRLVRDLSRSLQKKVTLEIEGEDTELDKSVIEDLLDPLIHCVRNSIDHGIETPEERREAGKPEAGTVHLAARNEGNLIIIEISDDGKGIDVNAIREKAVDRGIIHPTKALSDVEAFNLIFDPGFSTSQEITNVSGRGVGLDVVKRQIEHLNGSVDVWSEKGLGTRFTVKIPLTLAIIQGLLVRVGSEMYAIPITSVIESHRIRPSEIKRIDNYEVFNVREDVISLLRLNRIFQIPTEEDREYYYVVIVGSGDKKVGLIVDSLIGEEDVVIKPLKDHYTNAPGIAGANITGDGRVSLIIDVSQLLELGLAREREQRQLQGASQQASEE